VSVTDSRVPRPFVGRVEGARVPRRALALGFFAAELLLRVAADPGLDERPVERLLDDRVVERDLEPLDDARRRGDGLVWAMAFLSFAGGISFSNPLPQAGSE
jgi:hypothetical protein